MQIAGRCGSLAFKKSHWRWSHEWPKHVGDRFAIKLLVQN